MVAIGTAAIAPLIAALSHPSPSLWTHCYCFGLGATSAISSVEPLISAFQASADQGLQAYIIQALAQIGDRRAFDLLAEVVYVGSSQSLSGKRPASCGTGSGVHR